MKRQVLDFARVIVRLHGAKYMADNCEHDSRVSTALSLLLDSIQTRHELFRDVALIRTQPLAYCFQVLGRIEARREKSLQHYLAESYARCKNHLRPDRRSASTYRKEYLSIALVLSDCISYVKTHSRRN